jgi:hypothetical protein
MPCHVNLEIVGMGIVNLFPSTNPAPQLGSDICRLAVVIRSNRTHSNNRLDLTGAIKFISVLNT